MNINGKERKLVDVVSLVVYLLLLTNEFFGNDGVFTDGYEVNVSSVVWISIASIFIVLNIWWIYDWYFLKDKNCLKD